MASYAHPEVLVSTDWVSKHSGDPNVHIVEVDVDTKAYDEAHIPGAIAWAWNTELCDTVVRDILHKEQFEWLMTRSGIDTDSTVVIYGDNNNWFAAWAFWEMKVYGHADVRIMDGGRKKWLVEGRDSETKTQTPAPGKRPYIASGPDLSLRAFLPQVQEIQKSGSAVLIDVRSPQEFTGELKAPPGLPETCQRGGHIPGARGVCWSKACKDDGTFKAFEELQRLYGAEGVQPTKPAITYCRIGERSSHTWFVLKYLLGIPNVANYDGSWTEWGNLVGAPIEVGQALPPANS
ncbi:MAG: sulfurtransferase [Bryobacteraceae bacterium]|jgi:thiosulfate/3-mercaptopyruvate sulfurtransferase